MIWFYTVLAFLALFYAIISVVLFIGVSRLKREAARNSVTSPNSRGEGSEDLPFVSILIPARNEEKTMADCLESLIQQQYPSDRYEIVIVNDRSTDSTPAIIKGYVERCEKIKLVNIHSNNSDLTGKQNAMNEGLKFCTGEIILNTDADCIAGPLWVRRVVSAFTPETGLTIGFSIINTSNKLRGFRAILNAIQSLDVFFLMDSGAGSIGVKVPVSCLGTNIAYRRAILEDSGYLKIGYTITEDAALIQKVAKDPDWEITAIYDGEAAVLTFAVEGIKQFLSQRIRWTMGGQATRSWPQIPLYIIFLFHLCLVVSLPLIVFHWHLMFIALPSIFIKISLDFIRCWRVCKEFSRTYLLKLFIPYEFFMVFYSIIIGFGSFFIRKVNWKGEMYTRSARYMSNRRSKWGYTRL